jgi:integrase/recombinase XerD
MIKTMRISQEREAYLRDFLRQLEALGYRPSHHYSAGVREFLWRMQGQGKKLSQVDGEDIKNHYRYLLERPNYRSSGALSLHTIRGYLFGLRLFFMYVQKIGLIGDNPMSTLRFAPRPEGNRQVLTKTEISQLYGVCKNEQERALLSLLYGCGLRRAEAEKLNLRDVDLRAGWLFVRSGKGRKRRVVPMNSTVVEDLKGYRYDQRPGQIGVWTGVEDEKAFMLNSKGSRLRGKDYWKYFKAILKRSGVEKLISVHHLRHSIATHLLAGGMTIEQVRDFLGHECLESTQIYTRIQAEQLRL